MVGDPGQDPHLKGGGVMTLPTLPGGLTCSDCFLQMYVELGGSSTCTCLSGLGFQSRYKDCL